MKANKPLKCINPSPLKCVGVNDPCKCITQGHAQNICDLMTANNSPKCMGPNYPSKCHCLIFGKMKNSVNIERSVTTAIWVL